VNYFESDVDIIVLGMKIQVERLSWLPRLVIGSGG